MSDDRESTPRELFDLCAGGCNFLAAGSRRDLSYHSSHGHPTPTTFTCFLFLILFTLLAAPDKTTAGGKQFRASLADESAPTMPFPASAWTPNLGKPTTFEQSAADAAQSAGGNGTTGTPNNDNVFDKMMHPEIWSTEELAGYIASLLVIMTFCMKKMWSLRFVAIASNIAFIIYGYIAVIPPVFLLHVILMPINVVRILQLTRRSEAMLNWGTHDDNCGTTFRVRRCFRWKRCKSGSSNRETESAYADATRPVGHQSTGTSTVTLDALDAHRHH